MLCLLTLVSQKLSGVHVHTHMLGPPLFSSSDEWRKENKRDNFVLCSAYKGGSIHPVCCDLETVSLPTIMSSSPIPARALRLHFSLLVSDALRRCDVSSLVELSITASALS